MDYIFWIVLVLIAIFYLFKGNDMHKEKYEKIKQNMETQEKLK